MSLFTEYRGYRVGYNDNTDDWYCYECGVREPTLSKAKAKIDSLHLKLRKKSAVGCYEISVPYRTTSGDVRLIDAKIIEYLGEIRERTGLSSSEKKFVDHEVAVMAARHGSDRPARQKQRLASLAADVPGLDDALAKAQAAFAAHREAKEALDAAVQAIPRVQFEDIAGLVEASGHKFEEGET